MASRIPLLVASALLAIAGAAAAAEYWAYDIPSIDQGNTDHSTVVLSNEAPVPHTVDVFDASGPVATYTVPAGSSVLHTLAGRPQDTVLNDVGTYRFVTSSSDVVATMFTPIYSVNNNDASRLIRLEELGLDHYVWAHNAHTGNPIFPNAAFMSVVATEDGTTVTVTAAGPTRAAPAGNVPALAPGVPTAFTLDAWDVLSFHANSDLTGSRIRADKPVAVFSGHECTNVDTSVCDGLAEQVAPTDYAGTEYIGCSTVGIRQDDANVHDKYVIIATGAGTVSVAPDGLVFAMAGPGATATFDARDHVRITSTVPVLVGVMSAGNTPANEHPSLVQLLPTDRYTPMHITYHPTGWTRPQSVQVAAPAGVSLTFDGLAPLPPFAWEPVGATGFQCGTITNLLPGTHVVTASARVGVTVYAPDPNTSYWYRTDGECLDWAVLPTAPTSLAASTMPDPMDVQLDWGPVLDDGGCPVQRYHVYRSLAPGGAGTLLSTVPRSQLSYTDTVPQTCRSYYYTVTAETRVGEGPRSNEVSHFHATLPEAPALQLTVQDGLARVGWTRGDDGGCPVTTQTLYRNGVEHRLFNAVAGSYAEPHDICTPVTYTLTVTTVMGESPPSNVASYPDGEYPEACQDPPPIVPQDTADADGDGVPDGEDTCPDTPDPGNPDADGDGLGDACDPDPGLPDPSAPDDPEPPEPCATVVPPANVTAALRPGYVEVAWSFAGDCLTSRFLVFNATGELLVIVPATSTLVAHDRAPPGTHRYYVQGESGDGRLLDPARAVASNDIVVPCDCEDPAAPDPDRPQEADASRAGVWPWFLLAGFVGAGLLFLLVLTRMERDEPE